MPRDAVLGKTLLIIGALALVRPAPARADPPVPGLGIVGQPGVAVYADDMSTQVVSPRVTASAALPAQFGVDAHWAADVVTSASVDVITAATSKMSELRNEAGLALRRQNLLRSLDVDAGYRYSTERDATSHTADLGLRLELFDGNLEVGLRGGTSYNRLGVAGEPASAWSTLWIHDLDLALTFLLDRRTTLQLEASAYAAFGYQANPYRNVPIQSGPDLRGAAWLPEIVPDRRLRGAATVRLRRALGRRAAVSVEYRAYADDWGVVAHMQSVETSLELVRDLMLRLRERATTTSGARFYRARYEDPTTYRTRDRRLSPSESLAGGLAMQWEFGTTEPWPLTEANTSVSLSADVLAWHYPEFLGRVLTYTYSSEMKPLGWVEGLLLQLDFSTEW